MAGTGLQSAYTKYTMKYILTCVRRRVPEQYAYVYTFYLHRPYTSTTLRRA